MAEVSLLNRAVPKSKNANRGKTIIRFSVFLIASFIVILLLTKNVSSVPYSIYNSRDLGSMALANVLKDHGVSVYNVTNRSKFEQFGPGETVAVTGVQYLRPEDMQTLAKTGSKVVYLGATVDFPENKWVKSTAGRIPEGTLPACSVPEARQVNFSSAWANALLPIDKNAIGCYPASETAEQSYGLVETWEGKTRLIFVSDPRFFTNMNLADGANAALAINLLGDRKTLWWVNGAELSSTEEGPSSIAPELFGLVLLVSIAIVVWGLGRGRRLGKVIPEKMPIIVHHAEVVYGRARLYRRAGAYTQVANSLRERAAKKLNQLLWMSPTSGTESFYAQTARLTGQSEEQIRQLLRPGSIRGNRELKDIAGKLDELVKTVEMEITGNGK